PPGDSSLSKSYCQEDYLLLRQLNARLTMASSSTSNSLGGLRPPAPRAVEANSPYSRVIYRPRNRSQVLSPKPQTDKKKSLQDISNRTKPGTPLRIVQNSSDIKTEPERVLWTFPPFLEEDEQSPAQSKDKGKRKVVDTATPPAPPAAPKP